MGAPRKFDAETRERAVRMYLDRLTEHGDTKVGARRHVGALVDVNPATIRNWVGKDAPGDRRGTVTRGGRSRFRTESIPARELRIVKTNEILKTASAFLAAAEVDRRLR